MTCMMSETDRVGYDVRPIAVFTPYVMVYFWPNRHNFGDNELKFCILS